MKRIPLGPAMVFLGIFGGGLLWMFLIGLRFDYLITKVYDGDPGEAIWSLDPLFTMLAAIPGAVLVLVGLILTVQPALGLHEEAIPRASYLQLNLFYLGEICLFITVVVSVIGFLGTSSSVVEGNRIYSILMGVISTTCLIHIFSSLFSASLSRANSSTLSRSTAILTAVELVALLSLVIALRLYTWSFVRWVTIVISSSGFLGLLLLAPILLNPESRDGAEGEI